MDVDGLITLPSSFGPEETLSRLTWSAERAGMTVFCLIDHAAEACKASLVLRPTILVVLGNAKVGTALMQSTQAAGIDLPLKALVWQDAAGKTWLSYNDPAWSAQRHGLAFADAAVARMAESL